VRSQLLDSGGDSAGCTGDNQETREVAGGKEVQRLVRCVCMHPSFICRVLGTVQCSTVLADLTHDACLGASIAWACLPTAFADLINLKGNVMDCMAEAVDDADVVLYSVSKADKESAK
jgi:hypothetical protein